MSEIASKANAGPSASRSQPFAKKDGDAANEMLFAALFGGVVATEPDADPLVSGSGLVNAGDDAVANADSNSNILEAMQVVVTMMSGQHGKSRSSGSESSANSKGDAMLVDNDNPASIDEVESEETTPANSAIIGPMPLQHQAVKSLSGGEKSAVMTQMALEDEAVTPYHRKNRAAPNTSAPALHTSGAQSQMAVLPSSSLQVMKPTEKLKLQFDPIDDQPNGKLEIETRQSRPDGRRAIGPALYRQNISQASPASSKTAGGSDQAMIDMDGDMQFDSPDDFVRAVAGQIDRVAGVMGGQLGSGESLSANAVRQMQSGGLSVNAQMSQQSNGQGGGQSGSQSGSFISASAGITNGGIMEMLDMAQDNWTEMLLQRVERGIAGGKDKIEFNLNPRNLGKMRISLVVLNERANVHIQTETSVAAQLLSDAEARLAQMMDVSGLKFGNLTSQYNQNFGGNFAEQNSGQSRKGGSANVAETATDDDKIATNAEIGVEQSENLINMQA